MNYIDTYLPKIIKAKEKHYQILRYIIKKKLNGTNFNERCPFPKTKITSIKRINKRVFEFLNDEAKLKAILTGTPAELNKLKKQ